MFEFGIDELPPKLAKMDKNQDENTVRDEFEKFLSPEEQTFYRLARNRAIRLCKVIIRLCYLEACHRDKMVPLDLLYRPKPPQGLMILGPGDILKLKQLL